MSETSIPLVQDHPTVWVFNKPSGLAVQGGVGISQSVESILSDMMEEKVYPVHRLDKETGGLLMVAKTKAGAAKFGSYFHHHQVRKYYYAVVYGQVPAMLEMRDSVPAKGHGHEKPAYTMLKRVKTIGQFSLVALQIRTGRMHQIRIHLQQAGFPIVGDTKYGHFALNRWVKKQYQWDNLCLFAYSIDVDPENLHIAIEMPASWRTLVKKLQNAQVQLEP
jgi:23S rRNA pseudouridine955/2504/2580 synthase